MWGKYSNKKISTKICRTQHFFKNNTHTQRERERERKREREREREREKTKKFISKHKLKTFNEKITTQMQETSAGIKLFALWTVIIWLIMQFKKLPPGRNRIIMIMTESNDNNNNFILMKAQTSVRENCKKWSYNHNLGFDHQTNTYDTITK